jgi:hypothetical protein
MNTAKKLQEETPNQRKDDVANKALERKEI